MNKDKCKQLADETLQILRDGYYTIPSTLKQYSIRSLLKLSNRGTEYFDPDNFVRKTIFEVTEQTTLEAAQELAAEYVNVGVLNFASGKNPGGGFLRGTQAQEESLARSSALYASLSRITCVNYYDSHKEAKDPRYSHRMIWTPDCIVFRDDAGNLLEHPYPVNILTAAAPNRRALVESNVDFNEDDLETLISDRIERILRVFDLKECRTLVLGAWGCGVFGNDPDLVAACFLEFFERARVGRWQGPFFGRFDRIRFAICNSKKNLKAFQNGLKDHMRHEQL